MPSYIVSSCNIDGFVIVMLLSGGLSQESPKDQVPNAPPATVRNNPGTIKNSQVSFHRCGLRGCLIKKMPLLQNQHLQA